ncbi:MAG: S9 family peptidase [Candidatus Limnocylindrales bacterium]
MSRPARPEDMYDFRIATDPRLSADGRLIAFTVQTAALRRDGYRRALWLATADGSEPARPITIGAKHDRHPRFSPDGAWLAFLSDRRLVTEDSTETTDDREDGDQVHLLPLAGGEAHRLTDLPRGVSGLAWSPDGSRLAVLSASRGVTREEDARRRGKRLNPDPAEPPQSDYRYTDRLSYMSNGSGFTTGREAALWIVDAADGTARRLSGGNGSVGSPAWSPDGSRIAFAADRRPDRDQMWHAQVYVVDVATGAETRITDNGHALFDEPTWLPDGKTLAVVGHRFPAAAGSRNDIWLFAADGSEAGRDGGRNLSARHDLMPGSSMASDLTPGEPPRLAVTAGGRWITFLAPYGGSNELWRISTADGELVRLTEGHHYISAFDQVTVPRADGRSTRERGEGGSRIAVALSNPTAPTEIHLIDLPAGGTDSGRGAEPRRLTDLNAAALADVELVAPIERWIRVDGRDVQGWYIPPLGSDPTRRARAPLVTEIHGGPHTYYGWSPVWEFQVLAGAGMGVFYSNPRGSEGYGEAFNAANFRDWGPGPMRDVIAGIDALVEEGSADPDRLGVTGGSYGGYLTNWIVGHDDRFAAAFTARSVVDLTSQFFSGDIGGPEFGREEFGSTPWDDPAFWRDHSPLTYAPRIRTPILIQHSERDLRCTITQAEELFAALRTHRRPARLMRVPEESHELTRSGTPFRRVENLIQVRDWFRHFLVDGRRGLPPLPRVRAGR